MSTLPDGIGIVCRQTDCMEMANFRFTWPGRCESFCCAEHARKIMGIADAVGLPLQLIVLSEEHMGTEGRKSIEEQKSSPR